ncbi:MAG: MBL fold metallo-hydrolase [Bacilli bacterium]
MKYIKIVNGIIANNTYLLYNDSPDCLLIDPSIDYELIDKNIIDSGLNVIGILLTHAHYDHIYSVDYFVDKYDCVVYCDNNAIEYLKNPNLNLSAISNNAPNKVAIKSVAKPTMNKFKIGNFEIECVKTYGHTKACVTYLIDEFAFTGDFIFKETIGRTDFFDSSMEMMIRSLKNFSKIKKNYFILPGHGAETTLKEELRNNKFLIKYGE